MDAILDTDDLDLGFKEYMALNSNEAKFDTIEQAINDEVEKGMQFLQRVKEYAKEYSKNPRPDGIENGVVNEFPKTVAGKGSRGAVPHSALKRTQRKVQDPPTIVKKKVPLSQLKQGATKKRTANEAAATNASVARETGGQIPPGKLQIEVIGGPHDNMLILVEPLTQKAAQKKHCHVGRSSAKEYKEFGLSLNKDGEVSTKHGVIHRINKQFFYKDTGSSNGTRIVEDGIDPGDGQLLEKLEYFLLENGTKLKVGSCVLKFNF